MGKFINPFTDFGFKKIFGQEISKDLLIDFLNELLKGERIITDLTFLNSEQLPEWEEGRSLIYDIYCQTDTGEKIIVEMQNKSQPYFKERAIYYLSNAVVQQARRGNSWEFQIKAVYGVFFMNFQFSDTKEFRTDVILADRITGELFSDKFRQIFIALPLFNKEEAECETDFERWIYILKNMSTLERMPFTARKAVFEKLEEIGNVTSLSREDQILYERSINAYRTYVSVMRNERAEGFAEGRLEGHQEGLQEGHQKGRQEGILEGRQEGLTLAARRMKAMGNPAEDIQKATGLTSEVINSL